MTKTNWKKWIAVVLGVLFTLTASLARTYFK